MSLTLNSDNFTNDIFSSSASSLLPPPIPTTRLHLWSYCRCYLLPPSMEGRRDNFTSHLLHQLVQHSAPNMSKPKKFIRFFKIFVRLKMLASPTTVKYKKRASQCSGGHSCAQRYDSCEDRGRNNLYDWIPSSPNVFPSSPTWGAHSSKCLFRKIKLWGRRRNWGSLWKFGHAGGGVSCKN